MVDKVEPRQDACKTPSLQQPQTTSELTDIQTRGNEPAQGRESKTLSRHKLMDEMKRLGCKRPRPATPSEK